MKMLSVYKKIIIPLLLLINCFVSSCTSFDIESYVDNSEIVQSGTDRKQLYYQAEALLKEGEAVKAQMIFTNLLREQRDDIYYNCLWQLTKIYEKNAEYEKAVLALEELSENKQDALPQYKIDFYLLKNYYRLSNSREAKDTEKRLDAAYHQRKITWPELASILTEITDSVRIESYSEDLMFLGVIQKYFLYAMEGAPVPINENLAERLISNYNYFFSVLKQDNRSEQFKKNLAISIYDQLNKFTQYQMGPSESKSASVIRFTDYSEKQKKYLTESFYR